MYTFIEDRSKAWKAERHLWRRQQNYTRIRLLAGHKGRASTIDTTSEHSGLAWARHGLAIQRFKGGQIARGMRRADVGRNV
jgi:hypothetical protein